MHVCLFDIDGTLLNSGGAGEAAMLATLSSQFGATKSVAGITTAGRTDRAIIADLFAYHGLDADDAVFERFVAAYLRHLSVELSRRGGLVLPGIPLLLERLAARSDVRVGLLTGNYRQGARVKLSHFGLHGYFEFDLGAFGDVHLDRDDVAREALLQVRDRLNGSVDLARLWVIGDTPADVRCARAIGANIVAVATGAYSLDQLDALGPDHLFADFTQPEALLALLA